MANRVNGARFVKVFLGTFVLLGMVSLGLPALLQLADAPSFRLGQGPLLVIDWHRDAAGSRLTFGVLPLGLLALGVALLDQGRGRDRP